MSKFTSIRIYVPNGAITGGFYDVIGYYGPEIYPENGYYKINIATNSPLIKASGEYYYLTYSSEEGYSVNGVSTSALDIKMGRTDAVTNGNDNYTGLMSRGTKLMEKSISIGDVMSMQARP